MAIVIVLGMNVKCYAAPTSTRAQMGTFTKTHSVNISGYGTVNVTVKWKYTDGSSVSFAGYVGSSYNGSHSYKDCQSSYGIVSNGADISKYTIGVVFDNNDKAAYLITVYCDIYGQTGQYYSFADGKGSISVTE